jgi:hypothetical protein
MKKGRMGRSDEGSASMVERAFVRVWVMSYLLSSPFTTPFIITIISMIMLLFIYYLTFEHG